MPTQGTDDYPGFTPDLPRVRLSAPNCLVDAVHLFHSSLYTSLYICPAYASAEISAMSVLARPAVQKVPWRRRKACENCRRRKEKCDGLQPCGRCRTRRVEGECPRRSSCLGSPRQQQGKKGSHSHASDGASSSSNTNNTAGARRFPDDCQGTTNLPGLSRLGCRVSLMPRLIRNRHGEYVFLGTSANVSFLQGLRQIVYQTLGPCPFTDESVEKDLVDEEPAMPVNWPVANAEPQRPSVADARYCLQWYASATGCVFDLFSYEEVATEIIPWVEHKTATPSTTAQNCINFLVLAIGSQCGPQDRDAEGHAYFTYGRYLAMTEFISSPSLYTVQIYCLIAMYFLNSSHRTAASMHLGLAIRTAYFLGIHRADFSSIFSTVENANRERVWKVLRVLDLFLSTSLGQQPSTTETRDTLSQKEYSASTDLCYIFEKILSEIYSKQNVNPRVLQHVSKHHREWAVHFHEGLRVDRIPSEEYFGEERRPKRPNIGLCHLKEAYYWTIMLATRPHLMDLVQKHITTADRVFSPTSASTSATEDGTLLAHASVNSAVLTIDLLQGLLRADEIPKRLPFVMNSVFVSALVLGMGFFADLERLFPLGETLLGAQQLLECFQSHDELAKWSVGIVRSLREACSEFVNRRHERLLKRQRCLVEGLFGDIKSCLSEDGRSLPPPRTEESGSENDNGDEGLSVDDTQPDDKTPLEEESNTIWSQLFWNGSPSQLVEPDVELAINAYSDTVSACFQIEDYPGQEDSITCLLDDIV